MVQSSTLRLLTESNYNGTIRTQVNVPDATGNATTDTANLNAALSLAGASFYTVRLGKGTYVHNGLTVAATSGVLIKGHGSGRTLLQTAAGSTATAALNLNGKTGVVVEDVGFDGQSHATTKSGVYASTNGTTKNLTVQGCLFKDFMPQQLQNVQAAIYTWTSDGVTIRDNLITGCGRGIIIDQPDGKVLIDNNTITAPLLSNIMGTGIWARKGSTFSESELNITNNKITGADLDPTNDGREGHGISIFRCRDAHVYGNHCYNNGRGILVSYQCFGTAVIGNTVVGNYDSGIRTEPEITSFDTTVGNAGATGGSTLGSARGVLVQGNFARNQAPRSDKATAGGNFGIGIEISYSAGSRIIGNESHDNAHAGFHLDSDRLSVIGNHAYNNGQTGAGGSTAVAYSGFYVNTGSGSTYVGNHAYDNQATKTQNYGASFATANFGISNNFTGNRLGDVNGTALTAS